MVRFAPVISSAAVARAQVNNHRNRDSATRNQELTSLKNAPGGRVKLPSLYPAVSLRSLHAQPGNGQSGMEFHQTAATCFTDQGSIDTNDKSFNGDRTSVLGELRDRNGGASPKVKGTPLVVGAAGILRAATAFAVDNTTAEIAIQQAEEQIEEPEREVNIFRV